MVCTFRYSLVHMAALLMYEQSQVTLLCLDSDFTGCNILDLFLNYMIYKTVTRKKISLLICFGEGLKRRQTNKFY